MTSKLIGPTLLIVLLSKGAWAEIYKTTDEEGNTVFTDIPPGEKSEVVDLPAANIADSVEPAPQPETRKPPSGPKSGAVYPQPSDDVTIIGDAQNDRLDDKLVREKRHDVLEAEPPREVLEGERPQEKLDADPPRDIHEADRLQRRAPVQSVSANRR